MVCGPPVLLTSQNLVLSVRLLPCGPSVALSYSVKNSVNDGLPGGEHQICCLVLMSIRAQATHQQGCRSTAAPVALYQRCYDNCSSLAPAGNVENAEKGGTAHGAAHTVEIDLTGSYDTRPGHRRAAQAPARTGAR